MTPTVDVLKTKQSTDRKRWEELLRQPRFSDPAHLLRQTIGGLDNSQTPTGGGLSRHFSNHCEAQKLLCLNQSNFNPEFFVFRVSPFMKKLVVSKMMCDRSFRSLRSRLLRLELQLSNTPVPR